MNKAECRKYAGDPLRVGANSGLLCADQIEWLAGARVRVIGHRQTLVLNIYSRTEAAQGNMLPKWTVFQQKDDYLTLERKEDGATSWRKACFQDLSHKPKFILRCAFLTPADKRRVSRFFRDDMRGGFGCLTAHQKLIQENRQQVREREKRRRINARMQSVPAIPHGLRGWVVRKLMPAYFIYDTVNGRKEVPGICSACGKEISLSGVKHNRKSVCPRCGRELTMKSRGRMGHLHDRETCQIIQKTAPDEAVIRIFKAYRDYTCPGLELWESARQFICRKTDGKLNIEKYYDSQGVWMAGTRPVFSRYQYNFAADNCGCIYPGNLSDALQGTPWQYCPVAQFRDWLQAPMELLPFLVAHTEHPKLEHLVKMGFYELASDLVYRNWLTSLDESQNRTHRLLRVGPEDVSFLRGIHVTAKGLASFQAYCRLGIKDRQALFRWQLEHNISYIEQNILPFMAVTTPHRFMRYVDRQTEYLTGRAQQGRVRFSETADVVREYADYLDLCRKLELDLNDSVLFPRNLQKAHDRAASQWRQKLDAKIHRDFQVAMERIGRHMDYQWDGMMICCPQSPEEIIREGQALHHCVGTYVDRVARQECVILFLRRVAEVDKPFYTLEVRERKVVQARSVNNAPATPEVQRFLARWERDVLRPAA